MEPEKLDGGASWPLILDAVELGLVLVDADARVLLWNAWLARHSGVSAHHVPATGRRGDVVHQP